MSEAPWPAGMMVPAYVHKQEKKAREVHDGLAAEGLAPQLEKRPVGWVVRVASGAGTFTAAIRWMRRHGYYVPPAGRG